MVASNITCQPKNSTLDTFNLRYFIVTSKLLCLKASWYFIYLMLFIMTYILY